MFAVSCEQIGAGNIVAWNQTLNFVENGHRIKRAELGLKPMLFQPHGMAIGFTRLRAPRLAHVCPYAAAERDEFPHLESHGIGNANDHFEIALGVGNFSSFLHQLHIAASIRESA
jgi:hypothetical protein